MKCISEELIQKYIDKETSIKEEAYINSHLTVCAKCAEKIENMRQTAGHIKQLIGLIDEKDIEIPRFNMPVHQKKILYNNFKKIIYAASAACLLFLFLFIFQKQKDEVELVFSYDLESEFNANLPVSEQEMVIQIIDSEGKLIKY